MDNLPVIKPEDEGSIAVCDADGDETLPADTLAILTEFLREKALIESNEIGRTDSEQMFGENWQLSQFWYDDGTKKTLAKVCLKLILGRANKTQSRNVKIGLLSCPSLYKAIRNIHPNGIVRLFEYDKRFEVFNDDFVHYDYKEAAVDADYMSEYEDYFDIIIADPPFLSEECIQAMSTLVNRMRRDGSDIILCSGDVVARWAEDFMGLNQCGFRPQHERNLANEFRSYANFKLDALV